MRSNYLDYRYRKSSGIRQSVSKPKDMRYNLDTKEPEVATGGSLVRPGDITDVVDGKDLLDTLLAQNLSRVKDKVYSRNVRDWLVNEKKRQHNKYLAQATKAYEQIFAACGKHEFRNHDAGGYTVRLCDDCKVASPVSKETPNAYPTTYSFEKKKTDEMNKHMVKMLADRMIELDIEAGIFAWATEEDYPGNKTPVPSKPSSSFFRRKKS